MTPATSSSPEARRRRARLARLAERARAVAAVGAIAGTLLAVGVAGWQVARGWREQRAMARRELQDNLMVAAQMLASEALQLVATRSTMLMAPVLGAPPGSDGPRLEALADRARRLQAEWKMPTDSLAGFFRLPAAGAWELGTLRGTGVMADSAFACAVLDSLNAKRARIEAGRADPIEVQLHVDGAPLRLQLARTRDSTGAPIALYGLVQSRARTLAWATETMLAGIPYLPATFSGVDWITAARTTADARPVDRPLRDAFTPGSPRQNAALRLRMTDATGALLYETPHTPAVVWASPLAAEWSLPTIALTVHAAVPQRTGERLVAAAVPVGSQALVLGGVVLLAALFAVAAVLELRRQQHLARTRADFVSAISHELRTPLAHVSTLSETLLLGGAESPEQERKWLRAIHREAQRLGTMLENVLLFARGERHRLRLGRRESDLAELAHDVAATMAPFADARGACIEVGTPAACEAWVDAGAVRQIVVNLLDNAVKYGPAGQTITLSVAPGELDGAPAVTLTVDDEGPGIPEAQRERVWNAFVRLADDGGATGGSGLGLSVVRQLAERHGGIAVVRSAPGGGARFVVVLPAAAPVEG